ncbi:MAG TPA: ComEC/Rec2 family competence protein [Patescibacteria group bacterium]|nr:ComEC/Rec2 family competence protein [Patescibacteria group bacterium]
MSLETLTGLINSLLHEPQAGLLNGIIFGTKATLDPSLKNSLIETGTLHIIALSGMNISILVTLVGLVLYKVFRRPIANLLTIVIIIGFIFFVGPSPSVIRAGIMGGISLLSVAFGRQKWPLLSWILAVIIMLLLNPPWIGDLSFQLSVMATLGIIIFGSTSGVSDAVFFGGAKRINLATNRHTTASLSEAAPISLDGNVKVDIGRTFSAPQNTYPQRLIRWLWLLIADDLRVTLAAQAFTIPIILFQLHRISLISPLTNILIGWLMAPIMALGFTVIIMGMFFMPLAQLVAWFVWLPLTYVLWIIDLTAKIPFASISF